jgi:hypothetical protein
MFYLCFSHLLIFPYKLKAYHPPNKIHLLDFRFGLQWLFYLPLAKAKRLAPELARGVVRIHFT